ncbi:MAG TPA: hypothetical protein VIS10_18370 [Anaerolineales bacterium]
MKNLSFVFILLVLAACAPVDALQLPAGEVGSLEGQSQMPVETSPRIQMGDGRTVEIIGGDEDTLREFVQRWLIPVYPGAPGGVTTVRFGALPEILPVEIPIPKGAHIVASVQEPNSFTQIILDVDLSSDEITAFYSQSLDGSGWQSAPQESHSGFVGSGDLPARYCLESDKAYLEVWAIETSDGPTDVRLNLYASMVSNFCQASGPGLMDEGMSLIPSLKAPAGTQTLGGGAGSSGDGSAYVSTDLDSSLTVEALLEHYNAQLVAGGWELVEQGTTPVVAWSTWELADMDGDVWGGTLFVMKKHMTADRLFAMLSVDKTP